MADQIPGYLIRDIIDINDPMTVKLLNDNFKYIKLKLFGNLLDDDIDGYANINGSKIKAKSITAEQIEAGTITAEEISADYIYTGTILASQIYGDTIVGKKIQTSSGNTHTYIENSHMYFKYNNSTILEMGYSTLWGWLNAPYITLTPLGAGTSCTLASNLIGDLYVNNNKVATQAYVDSKFDSLSARITALGG